MVGVPFIAGAHHKYSVKWKMSPQREIRFTVLSPLASHAQASNYGAMSQLAGNIEPAPCHVNGAARRRSRPIAVAVRPVGDAAIPLEDTN